MEDSRPFVVKISRYSKYAPRLKNSISFIETVDGRISLMKDSAAVEEAVRMYTELCQGDYGSLAFNKLHYGHLRSISQEIPTKLEFQTLPLGFHQVLKGHKRH